MSNEDAQIGVHNVHDKMTLHEFIGNHDKDLTVVGVLVAVATYTANLTQSPPFNVILTLLLLVAAVVTGWQALTAVPEFSKCTLSLVYFRLSFSGVIFLLTVYLVVNVLKQQNQKSVPYLVALACVAAVALAPLWLSHVPFIHPIGSGLSKLVADHKIATAAVWVCVLVVVYVVVLNCSGLYALLNVMGSVLQPPTPNSSIPLPTPTVKPQATATP